MIQELLDLYRDEISLFFSGIDSKKLEKVFESLGSCKGLLICSGIGKSALVAEKFAVTLTATGTRALFLSPIEALHGDMGMVTPEDIFIVISKSGQTEELLNLLPYIRNKGAKIVSFTSNEKSHLAQAADLHLELPFHRELCPFNMAPTISTTCQTILGDILAVALMKKKNFTLNEYAMNHPAGTIGKRITVKVRHLMLEGDLVPRCPSETPLINALEELSSKKAGCVLIMDSSNQFLGIFTDGDLRRALQKFGADVLQRPMSELMTKTARFTHPEALAWDALKVMENQKSPIMVLPVLDEKGGVAGILKLHDILQSGI